MEKENKDIWFSCGCRDWRITASDEKGIIQQPENTFETHQCDKITVWQERKGVKRYFKNNSGQLIRASSNE